MSPPRHRRRRPARLDGDEDDELYLEDYLVDGTGSVGPLEEEELLDDAELEEALALERAIAAARRAGGVEVDPTVGFGRPSVRRR